jgi:hypothetical protein
MNVCCAAASDMGLSGGGQGRVHLTFPGRYRHLQDAEININSQRVYQSLAGDEIHLRGARETLPPLYDARRSRRSARYTSSSMRFIFISEGIHLVSQKMLEELTNLL